jgi:hypothetical protein
MKKIKKLFSVFVIILIPVFSISCSDDDEVDYLGDVYTLKVSLEGDPDLFDVVYDYGTIGVYHHSNHTKWIREGQVEGSSTIYEVENAATLTYSFSALCTLKDNTDKDSLRLNVKGYFKSTQLVDTTHVFYSISEAEYAKDKKKPKFEIDLRSYLK